MKDKQYDRVVKKITIFPPDGEVDTYEERDNHSTTVYGDSISVSEDEVIINHVTKGVHTETVYKGIPYTLETFA